MKNSTSIFYFNYRLNHRCILCSEDMIFTCKTTGDSTELIRSRRNQVTGFVHLCLCVCSRNCEKNGYSKKMFPQRYVLVVVMMPGTSDRKMGKEQFNPCILTAHI
jgi:hypothetical protein